MIETSQVRAIEEERAKPQSTRISGRSKSDHHLGTNSAGTTGRETLSRTRLTDKDRQLIGVLAIARYLSNHRS
jgi:hypothetical protein